MGQGTGSAQNHCIQVAINNVKHGMKKCTGLSSAPSACLHSGALPPKLATTAHKLISLSTCTSHAQLLAHGTPVPTRCSLVPTCGTA